MKKSEEKESPSENSKRSNSDPVKEALEKIKKELGDRCKEEPMEEGYTVWLNPPKSLVEKMQRAEAAKKKK